MSAVSDVIDAKRATDAGLAPRRGSLTTRLLAVAAGFVLLTETLVFVPSIAAFRDRWAAERFDTGELAVLASRTPDGNGFRKESAPELLRAAEIVSVVMVDGDRRKQLVGAPPQGRLETVEFERPTLGDSIGETFESLFGPSERTLVLVGRPRSNAALRLEVAVREAPLRDALWRETGRVLATSLGLALLIAALLYASLADAFVRPMRRLTGAISRFRAAPQDASERLIPSGRNDEIGEAEAAFADMQDALRQSLLQRERLAQLGVAVSKIAHDLRHSLGAAQLVSERIAMVDDPSVRAAAPRLERALERAAGLAESTLRYGRADERAPEPADVALAGFLDEVAEDALAGLEVVSFVNDVDEEATVRVDPDQAHRVFVNLIRNAAQAMAAHAERRAEVKVTARRDAGRVRVIVADVGPGLPAKVRARLFEPFAAGGVSGGTGLGLAIARDLARLNGGDVRLIETGPAGTVFEVALPSA